MSGKIRGIRVCEIIRWGATHGNINHTPLDPFPPKKSSGQRSHNYIENGTSSISHYTVYERLEGREYTVYESLEGREYTAYESLKADNNILYMKA